MDSDLISAPLRLEDEDTAWDAVADVIVVGCGGAGICAAIEAAEQGAQVIALDRYDGGGATARSGGVVYAGATRFQREAGFEDSPEEMYRYLSHELALQDDHGLKAYCSNSAEDVEWLGRHGVPFSSSAHLEKADYPPDGKFLYFSGNELRARSMAVARPAPRGHRTVGSGLTGAVYFGALRSAAEALGIRLLSNAPVTRLIQNGRGDVIGVEARIVEDTAAVAERRRLFQRIKSLPFLMKKARKAMARLYAMERGGRPLRLRARGGVILATGGFGYNQKLIRNHAPVIAEHSDKVIRMGSLGCDGSGVELGQSVGGDTGLMENLMLAQTIGPNVLRKGIFVNIEGKRFVGEDAYNGDIGGAISRQAGSRAWMILGGDQVKKAIWACLTSPRGTFLYFHLPALLRILFASRMSWSISGLAKRCGINGQALVDQVAQYNADIAENRSDAMDKDRKLLGRIGARPFFAIDYSTGSSFSFASVFTLGGLRVSHESGEVLDRDERPIPGLYAAGRTAVGLCSTSYVSGMSLGDGVFSGRRAARHAARRGASASQHQGPRRDLQ